MGLPVGKAAVGSVFPWLAGCPALGDVGGDHARSFRVG